MAEHNGRLFTGIQPSGELHIGNYFGAMNPFIELCRESEDSMVMIADYHALTTVHEGSVLREHTASAVKDYIATGGDPARSVIFKQSDVPAHTELAWILECLVSVPFLMQAHAYKDKVAKGLEANAGLFNYPMLMAADILLYDTETVPVGADQRQHVEYAREVAGKFNTTFGETFVMPKEKILTEVGAVPGTDGQKMSKSYRNTIPLFGTKDEIVKAVMSIVTDSTGTIPENVLAIHRLFRKESELAVIYEKDKGNYKALKEALIADIEDVFAPMREKRASITDNDVREIFAEGGEKARDLANKKMLDVREKIGIFA